MAIAGVSGGLKRSCGRTVRRCAADAQRLSRTSTRLGCIVTSSAHAFDRGEQPSLEPRCHARRTGKFPRQASSSVPLVFVRLERRLNNLAPSGDDISRSAQVPEPVEHDALLGLELREGQQEPLYVDEIRACLGTACTSDQAYHLHSDKLGGSDHAYLAKGLRRRKHVGLADIHEMAIRWLPHLIDSKALPRDDLAHAYRETEPLREARSKQLGELGGARGEQVDVLRHALRLAVRVDGVSAENDSVGAASKKVQDLAKNRGKGSFFVCHEFS